MKSFIKVLNIAISDDVYLKYADDDKMITFGAFELFCKDHGIFPGVCSKASIKHIFLEQTNQIVIANTNNKRGRSLSVKVDKSSSKLNRTGSV